MCLVKKQKQYLEKVKKIIDERIEFNFSNLYSGKRSLSSILKELIDIKKDVTDIFVDVNKKLLEIDFQEFIKEKSKVELILLKEDYKKEILLCNSLFVNFQESLSNIINMSTIVLSGLLLLNTFVSKQSLECVDIVICIAICMYVVLIISVVLRASCQNKYHIKVKNLTVIFNNIMESCILDIDKRLYEIENRINMEGYNTYMVNIKPENKMGGSDK